MKKALVVLFILLTFIANSAIADSIWKQGFSSSPYSTQKAFKVGDIIYILVLESSSALQKTGTTTDVKDDLSLGFTHTLEQLAPFVGRNTQMVGKAQNKYKGEGKTSRSADIKAKVASRVTEVLPNGNLKVVGHHQIEINNDKQEIIISGIIRAKDVSMANSIFSYQVASAKISVRGQGTAAEAESPGWITRIINWIF